MTLPPKMPAFSDFPKENKNMDVPKRKSPRIPRYDYSTPNYYFITICTANRKCIFGKPNNLNQFGIIAKDCLLKIPVINPDVRIDKYVVMPNHVHAIMVIDRDGLQKSIPQIVGQYKMAVTKKIRSIELEKEVWQRSFHDHVIRNQERYELIWTYIENNPLKWEDDCFYEGNACK